jgi:hypothetical protein
MPTSNWIPEIMYEETDEGLSSNIPFIMVPKNEVMPKVVFIFESRETGELEPNEDGDPVPIMEMDLHQYADMAILKEGLSLEDYDNVRRVLGLQPMRQAVSAGRAITDNIRKKIENK